MALQSKQASPETGMAKLVGTLTSGVSQEEVQAFQAETKKYPLLNYKFWILVLRESLFITVNKKIWGMSATLTYSSIVSFVPLLAIAFLLFQLFGGIDYLMSNGLQPLLVSHFGVTVGEQIYGYATSFQEKMGGASQTLGAVSAFTFLASILLLMNAISQSLDEILGVIKQRTWVTKLISFWVILTLSPLVIALSTPKSYDLLSLVQGVPFLQDSLIFKESIRLIMTSFFSFAAFFGIYYVLPTRRAKLRNVAIGALSATLFFTGLHVVNSMLTQRMFSDSVTTTLYGTAPLIAFVFFYWLRFVWFVVLLGASFVPASEKVLKSSGKKQGQTQTVLKQTVHISKVFHFICLHYRESGSCVTERLLFTKLGNDTFSKEALQVLLDRNVVTKVGDSAMPGSRQLMPTFLGLKSWQNPEEFVSKVLGLKPAKTDIGRSDGFMQRVTSILPFIE